jgi:toxin YhaV
MALMDVFTHFSIVRRERRGIRPEEIKEKIPLDPFASHFALTGALKHYGRVKKMGLPDRYRLFFRAIQTKEYKAIFVLWLGYPRKQGDKNDCYKVFTKIVQRGDFPNSLDALILDSQED